VSHEHLEKQYFADAAVHQKPWELWFTVKNEVIGWRQCNSVDMDFSNGAYRRHKHADLMIQAHLHPEYEWELQNDNGVWVGAVPAWDEKLEYRRKEQSPAEHPHQDQHADFIREYNIGKGNEWECQYADWAKDVWTTPTDTNGLYKAVCGRPEAWTTRRKAAPLPPVLRELSDEEINRVFGMCGVPQTQTLEWLVKECIKAAREKQQ